jgi:hypothetical protein
MLGQSRRLLRAFERAHAKKKQSVQAPKAIGTARATPQAGRTPAAIWVLDTAQLF